MQPARVPPAGPGPRGTMAPTQDVDASDNAGAVVRKRRRRSDSARPPRPRVSGASGGSRSQASPRAPSVALDPGEVTDGSGMHDSEIAGERNVARPLTTVCVIQLGSQYTRFGGPREVKPTRLRTMVAFRRLDGSTVPPPHSSMTASGEPFTAEPPLPPLKGAFKEEFSHTVDQIVGETALEQRRRGGGRPIPWTSEIDVVAREPLTATGIASDQLKVLVGPGAERMNPQAPYDVVQPIWRGRLNTQKHGLGPVRRALEEVFRYVIAVWQSTKRKANEEVPEEVAVVLVVPEEATRYDVSVMVETLFSVSGVAAVFPHHTSVCASYGAGLSTCVVVDLGHTTSYVVCIDEGVVVPESRMRLTYGGVHVSAVIRRLLTRYKAWDTLEPHARPSEMAGIVETIKEELVLASGTENDVLFVARTNTTGRVLRVKVGIGPLIVPIWGLFFPSLFNAASGRPITDLPSGNEDDDNSQFIDSLVDDSMRTVRGLAAKPIGYFGNSEADNLISVDDAIVRSVKNAAEAVSKQDIRRRLLSAVLMVGGCSEAKNLGETLEKRVRRRLPEVFGESLSKETTVDVLVGGKELPAGTLAWAGGAVAAQAESSADIWVTIDEWKIRGSRAIREKSPFFW